MQKRPPLKGCELSDRAGDLGEPPIFPFDLFVQKLCIIITEETHEKFSEWVLARLGCAISPLTLELITRSLALQVQIALKSDVIIDDVDESLLPMPGAGKA